LVKHWINPNNVPIGNDDHWEKLKYFTQVFKTIVFLFLNFCYLFKATDAYCLLDIYNFLRDRVQPSDYLQSFRGKKLLPCQTSNDTNSIPWNYFYFNLECLIVTVYIILTFLFFFVHVKRWNFSFAFVLFSRD
jgi:hypothetical protein